MRLFDILAILISLSAAFSWFNHRFLKMPTAIGLMLIALLLSLFLLLPLPFSDGLEADAQDMLNSIDFNETVLHGMLSFLLFAGALHVKLQDLAEQKWVIGLLATFGVLCSTVLVGLSAYSTVPSTRAGCPLDLLPAVRGADRANRPDRRAWHPEERGGAKEP